MIVFRDAFGEKLEVGDVVCFSYSTQNTKIGVGVIYKLYGTKSAMLYSNRSPNGYKVLVKNCSKVFNPIEKIGIISEYLHVSCSLNYQDRVDEFDDFLNQLKFKEI